MDFFKKITKPVPTSDEPAGSTRPSNTDLFGSAKVLAGAAQAQYTGQSGSYDNAEIAGAGANVLGAASEYGKFDETQGVGKYVNDAEGYLKQYSSTNTTKAATTGGDDIDQAEVKPINTPEFNPSVDDTEDGFSNKSVVPDASDVYGKSSDSYEQNTAVEDFPKKVAVEEDKEGGYTGGDASGDKYGDNTTKDFEKKPYGGGRAKFAGSDETETYGDEKSSGGGDDYTEAVASEVKYGQGSEDQDKEDGFSTKISDSYNTGSDDVSGKFGKSSYGDQDTEKKPLGGGSYGDDTEESFEKKPIGSDAFAGVDAGEDSGDGYGQYVKKAGGFFNKE